MRAQQFFCSLTGAVDCDPFPRNLFLGTRPLGKFVGQPVLVGGRSPHPTRKNASAANFDEAHATLGQHKSTKKRSSRTLLLLLLTNHFGSRIRNAPHPHQRPSHRAQYQLSTGILGIHTDTRWWRYSLQYLND